MISEQDVEAYKRDGVIVVPEVLGADTLAQVRSVIAELVEDRRRPSNTPMSMTSNPAIPPKPPASAGSRHRTRCTRCSTRSCAAPPCSTS